MLKSSAVDLEALAERASRRGGVRLYGRSVARVLSALLATDDFWQVVDRAALPVPGVAAIVEELLDLGWVERRGDGLALTEAGREAVERFEVRPPVRHACPACEGRGVPFWADRALYQTFLALAKDRPESVQEFDQGYVTPETTVARVLHMASRGDLDGKEILVLAAEDDLTGLAIALTRRAKRVLILDIDPRLIEFDRRAFQELGIENAEARVFDLRNPFPEEWLGAFDVFVTDPPETPRAFRAFIARGIAALRAPGSAGYFGLTLRDASLFRWAEFQRALLGYGVVLTEILQDFNVYEIWPYHGETRAARIAPTKRPPRAPWYRSSWQRVEALPGFRGENLAFTEEDLREIYLDEESSTT